MTYYMAQVLIMHDVFHIIEFMLHYIRNNKSIKFYFMKSFDLTATFAERCQYLRSNYLYFS